MNRIALVALAASLALVSCGKSEKKTSEATPAPAASEVPKNQESVPAPGTEPAPDESAAATPAAAPAPLPPLATSFADPKLQHGYDVFQKWCAPCHARGPHRPGTQALEVKYKGSEPAALQDRTDLTPDLTAYYVRNGVSIMPPFRKTEITDDDLAALGAYIARQR